MTQARRYTFAMSLHCEESGQRWNDPTRRWRVYFTDDDPPQGATYCPACAEREFGDGPQLRTDDAAGRMIESLTQIVARLLVRGQRVAGQ